MKRFVHYSAAITVTVFTLLHCTQSIAQPLRTLSYLGTSEDFANPERGFYRYRNLTSPSNFQGVRADEHSLIYGRIPASDFRDGPMSQGFLDAIQDGFDQARANGIKVKPRVLYNDGPSDGGGADASKSVVLGHIAQLKPLFEANKDVIYVMDAGFIGLWGEWHSSTNGLDNNSDRSEILAALLDALPDDRMVGVRTPHFKREIYNGSPIDGTLRINNSNAFDGSDLSRVGHLNDCFLASSSDFGTYIHQASGWSRSAELDYIGGESRFAPFGGETCARSAFSTGANAVDEMEQLHIDYLNYDYNQAVHADWVQAGVFDEISRRLGYRYELQSVELPQVVRPSGIVELNVDIDNYGFGELFNPRTVEVTLLNNATNELRTAPLSLDPRYWTGGSSNLVQSLLSVPEDLPEGTYTVGLWLPDADASLRDDARYSIRFANENVWDAVTGTNILTRDLEVSRKATGTIYANLSEFAEVSSVASLQPTVSADFDRDGDVDVADVDALVPIISLGASDGSQPLFDLNGDGSVNNADLTAWLREAGDFNLGAGTSYLYGDANLDGFVDVSDFNNWNSNRDANSPTWSTGDFNADGFLDFSDFDLWSSNKFQSANAMQSVPEPTTSLLFMAMLSLLICRMTQSN